MTVIADAWDWSFASKELFSMAVKAAFVFGIFSYIRKRLVPFPGVFPVLRRKRMARVTGKLLGYEVRCMRELRIVDSSPLHF